VPVIYVSIILGIPGNQFTFPLGFGGVWSHCVFAVAIVEFKKFRSNFFSPPKSPADKTPMVPLTPKVEGFHCSLRNS
jgi:hypothetical protein